MGKKHASQYANFGWLLQKQIKCPVLSQTENVFRPRILQNQRIYPTVFIMQNNI